MAMRFASSCRSVSARLRSCLSSRTSVAEVCVVCKVRGESGLDGCESWPGLKWPGDLGEADEVLRTLPPAGECGELPFLALGELAVEDMFRVCLLRSVKSNTVNHRLNSELPLMMV